MRTDGVEFLENTVNGTGMSFGPSHRPDWRRTLFDNMRTDQRDQRLQPVLTCPWSLGAGHPQMTLDNLGPKWDLDRILQEIIWRGPRRLWDHE